MPVPDARRDTGSLWRIHAGNPVHARRGELAALERVLRSDGHNLFRGIDVHDVQRNGGGEAEPFPLPDGKAVDPLVPAYDLAGPVLNRACSRQRAMPFEIGGMAAVGDEADLVAVRLTGHCQPEIARLCADG